MDNNKRKSELDPDYKNIPERPFKRIRTETEDDSIKNYDRMVQIIQREFQKEICSKREEYHKIQQQLLKAQKTLHLLKYVVVKSFYESKELNTNETPVIQAASNPELAEPIVDAQSRIHPAIKKLLGKKPLNYEPYRTRFKTTTSSYGNKKVTIKGENITIKEENTEDISTDHLFNEPSIIEATKINMKENKEDDNMVPIRNRDKSKYRILVGNISKWMPSNSSQDNSTHKWMVYVRGPKDNPDISNIVKKVRFFLHPSYQPNDIVDVQETPFHLSRRGWGEFPLRVQIHFKNSKNKPIDIIHNIKLDRTYTGRQTMGEETLVDVWLFENDAIEESENDPRKQSIDFNLLYLKRKYPEENLTREIQDFVIKKEIDEEKFNDNKSIEKCEDSDCHRLSNFIECCSENLKELRKILKETNDIYQNNDENSSEFISIESIPHLPEFTPIKIESNTLNGNCDSYETQASLLNIIGVKEVIDTCNKTADENMVCSDHEMECIVRDVDEIYLEDHCYTKLKEPLTLVKEEKLVVKKMKYIVGKSNWTSLDANYLIDKNKYKIDVPLENFNSISQIVYFLFKSLPLVSEMAKEVGYICLYPYAATTLEQYLSWNSAKQFCAEWYRAKYIRKFLTDHNLEGHQDWTIKIILMYGQAHGFALVERYDLFHKKSIESGKFLPNRFETPIEINTYTEAVPIKELLDFKNSHKQNCNDIYDIDVLNTKIDLPKSKDKVQGVPEGFVDFNLPVSDMAIEIKNETIGINNDVDDTSLLPCTYIRQTAEQIGINMELEETNADICPRTTEKVILKAVMCLAEELIRKAIANNLIEKKVKNSDKEIEKSDILNVLLEREEFSIFLNAGLGKSTSL